MVFIFYLFSNTVSLFTCPYRKWIIRIHVNMVMTKKNIHKRYTKQKNTDNQSGNQQKKTCCVYSEHGTCGKSKIASMNSYSYEVMGMINITQEHTGIFRHHSVQKHTIAHLLLMLYMMYDLMLLHAIKIQLHFRDKVIHCIQFNNLLWKRVPHFYCRRKKWIYVSHFVGYCLICLMWQVLMEWQCGGCT